MINRKTTIATFASLLLMTASPMAMAANDKAETVKENNRTTATTTTSRTGGEIKAEKLIGADIRNNLGEDIGEVEGIILNQDGKAVAVIVGVGGFLGIGERDVAIDWNDLQVTNGGDKVTVSMSKAQLKSLPEYEFQDEKLRRTSFYDRNYRGEVVADAGDRRPGMKRADDRAAMDRDDKRPAMDRADKKREREFRAAGFGPAGEIRTTALLGAEVVNAQNEEIGEVEEILIGKSGKLQAVLSIGGFLGMGEHEVAVDWDNLEIARVSDDRDDLQVRLNMTKDALKQMPEYDRKKTDRR